MTTINWGEKLMKSDALTLAVIVFLVGLLASGLGLTEWLDKDTRTPTELQRGFQVSK